MLGYPICSTHSSTGSKTPCLYQAASNLFHKKCESRTYHYKKVAVFAPFSHWGLSKMIFPKEYRRHPLQRLKRSCERSDRCCYSSRHLYSRLNFELTRANALAKWHQLLSAEIQAALAIRCALSGVWQNHANCASILMATAPAAIITIKTERFGSTGSVRNS